MIERHIHSLAIEALSREEPARSRERLKGIFPPGATRRMTQLGLLIGSVLHGVPPDGEDTVVYATTCAEALALEAFLASFPEASPVLFQTSIHPSAVQQALIGRQRSVRELIPMSGGPHLAAHAVQAALLTPAPRAIICGGEERAGRFLTHGVGSEDCYAFALGISTEAEGAIGRIGLEAQPGADGGLTLAELFAALCGRRALRLAAAPGLILSLAWS